MRTLFLTMTRPMMTFGPQFSIKPAYSFSSFTDKMEKNKA